MKKLMVIVTLVLSLIGCQTNDVGVTLDKDGTYTGTGIVITKEYDLSDFEKIDLLNDFDGRVSYGESFAVKVTTNEEVFQLLDVSVVQGKLVAKVIEDVNLRNTRPSIEITMPVLNAVNLYNDSKLTLNDQFESSNFEANTFNDSSFVGNIIAKTVSLTLASDSYISLKGTAGDIRVFAKSDANCDLKDLLGQQADISLLSDAKCTINVEGNVKLTAESSPTLTIVNGTYVAVSVEEDVIVNGGHE